MIQFWKADGPGLVRGVIACPPAPADSIPGGTHQSENFESVRRVLEEHLDAAQLELARNDRTTWKMVVRGRSDVIIGWAVSVNEFFERVEDIATFRTSREPPPWRRTPSATMRWF